MRRPITCVTSLVGGIFLLVGLPFAVIALVMYLSATTFMQNAITTSGTIENCYWKDSTDFNSKANAAVSSTCQPTVRFHTREGREIIFTSNFSSSDMHEGQEVLVSYHADQPHDARLSTFTALWLLPIIFGGSVGC
ncbi:DUF3592 domain-containing protein [Ktedonospora formicarum]|uniref:DUF3592 domain-containing protein n=1 Tax=Ktedonospora formicarum TaxID=2778364 RepID=A0A8J3I0S5_9CHLR|nr:DUF3592 domain-containing protein [Ktedonospora formicarum]GHO47882.1 hypothetical protein KSX_60450 [Ktedonospora formicarum]